MTAILHLQAYTAHIKEICIYISGAAVPAGMNSIIYCLYIYCLYSEINPHFQLT